MFGGNDGTQDEIERSSDDDVVRLPRCSRVRDDLVPGTRPSAFVTLH